jgi:AcrR family transcriptional regulator
VDSEPGLRERKKLRTRQLIAETARRLFVERGFDAVPVADIARAAEVSDATVFNYFPTKEDLVFYGMEAFESELLDAVSNRPVGEPVVKAFGRFVTRLRGLLAGEDDGAIDLPTGVSLASVAHMIAISPALVARQQVIFSRYTAALAEVITSDTGVGRDDVRPWVVAHALMGVHQALITYVHTRLVEGASDRDRLARDVRTQAQRALRQLEAGLGDYARRPTKKSGSRGGSTP